jgi:hypothetical protein
MCFGATVARADYNQELHYLGGRVMTHPHVHLIFWLPPKLQDGTDAKVPPDFIPTIKQFFSDLGGTGYFGVLTQYFQITGGSEQHIQNTVTYDGRYLLNTSDYPSTGLGHCLGAPTTNCETAGTIENLIRQALGTGLKGGDNEAYIVFTAPGEYICSGIGGCAPGANCAFHNYFHTGLLGTGEPVIYAVEPYQGDNCNSTLPEGPNSPHIDRQVVSASHEFMEMVTDPLNDAWQGNGGKDDEIADKCNDTVGLGPQPFPYDYGHANQLMFGHYYLALGLWSNVAGGCVRNDGGEHLADITPTPGFTGENDSSGPWTQQPYGGPGEPVALASEDFPQASVVNIEYETGLPAPNDHVSLCVNPTSGTRTARSDGTIVCTDHIPAEPMAGAIGVHRVVFRTGSGRPIGINFHLEAGTVSPWELQFGNQPVGSPTPTQTVTVTNTSATSPITIGSLTIASSAAIQGFFMLPPSTTCKQGIILGPGASCGVDVYFLPTIAGNQNGTLTISDSGNHLPQVVKLEGTGTQNSDCDNDGDPGDSFEYLEC